MIKDIFTIIGALLVGGLLALIVTFSIFKVTQIISAAWQSGKDKARRR